MGAEAIDFLRSLRRHPFCFRRVLIMTRLASRVDRSPVTQPLFLSPEEAAVAVGVSHWTIRRMINDGRLKAVRVGRLIRIDQNDLYRSLRPVGRQVRGGGFNG